MNNPSDLPKTLIGIIRHFSDPDVCIEFLRDIHWPDGVTCPRCESKRVSFISTRRVWKCLACEKQFSVKVGTIFEASPIGLDKWLAALWQITNCKNGISSCEVQRALGVTQKTAWFMGHRIRLAMQRGTFDKLRGEVEADETFIGGKARNMHPGKRKAKGMQGRGTVGKTVVLGLLERHGEVRTKVVPNTRRRTLAPEVMANVEAGSELFTDALASYTGLSREYIHQVIDHAEKYVDGNIHTNGMENFWSLLKRGIKGTYVSVEPFHLFRYLDEQSFRFNNRKDDDATRFRKVVETVVGRRLTYKQLAGNVMPLESNVREEENGVV